MTERNRSIEVLEIFAEEGSHERISEPAEGVWRQRSTPDVSKAAWLSLNASRQAEEYRRNPAVRAAAAERYQRKKTEREDEIQKVLDESTQHLEIIDARSVMGALRARCADCRRRMPGDGWCIRHTDRREAMHAKMPNDRKGVTHHFTITAKKPDGDGTYDVKGYLTTGEYEDGTLGEIFVKLGKPGSSEAMYDQWAISFSKSLQHGVPLAKLVEKYKLQRFEPSGATKNPDIKRCSSIVDYIAQYLEHKYLKPEVKP